MRKLSRATIAEAALDQARADGIDRVSIRNVAGVLGVVPSALYGHIADKDDLYRAIAELAFTQLAEALRAAIDDDPVERIRRLLRAYYTFASDDPVRYWIMTRFRPQFGAEWSADQLPAGVEAFTIASRAVSVAIAAGRLRPADPDLTALAIFATVRGTTMFTMGARDESADRELAFAVLDTALAAFTA